MQSGGYGQLTTGGMDRRAHVFSWILHHGSIPNGLWVLHHCDNPPCVRPDHLYLGTPADNSRDRVVRDRVPRGERHYGTRLTEVQVVALRERHAAGEALGALAQEFGLSYPGAHQITRGLTWARAGGPTKRLRKDRSEAEVLHIFAAWGSGHCIGCIHAEFGGSLPALYMLLKGDTFPHLERPFPPPREQGARFRCEAAERRPMCILRASNSPRAPRL